MKWNRVRTERVDHPGPRGAGVGKRLQGREGLGRHDEQRLGRVEIGGRLPDVGTVDIRNETKLYRPVGVVHQCLVCHGRPEIRTSDPDVDDGPDMFSGSPGPDAGADLVREHRHSLEHVVNLGNDIHAVHFDDGVRGRAQSDMEHGAALGRVDPLPREHRLDLGAQSHPLGKGRQQFHRSVGDPVLGIVEVEAVGFHSECLAPVRVVGEQAAQMDVGELGEVLVERCPFGRSHDGGRVLDSINGRLDRRHDLSGPPSPMAAGASATHSRSCMPHARSTSPHHRPGHRARHRVSHRARHRAGGAARHRMTAILDTQ